MIILAFVTTISGKRPAQNCPLHRDIVPDTLLSVKLSAFTQKGCKNAANDPHAELGDKFKEGLPGWCRTKKAGSMFFWLGFRESLPLSTLSDIS